MWCFDIYNVEIFAVGIWILTHSLFRNWEFNFSFSHSRNLQLFMLGLAVSLTFIEESLMANTQTAQITEEKKYKKINKNFSFSPQWLTSSVHWISFTRDEIFEKFCHKLLLTRGRSLIKLLRYKIENFMFTWKVSLEMERKNQKYQVFMIKIMTKILESLIFNI